MADSSRADVKDKSDINRKTFSKRRSKPGSDYIVRRRCPPRSSKGKNDIFVTNTSNFRGQFSQCMKLIDDGETEIIIHSLGAAIPKAINLALQLHEHLMGTFDVATTTNTVDVIDDLEPLTDDLEGDTRVRSNSSVHIKLYKHLVQE
ncbi:ribonuclease P protein subunit p20-like isoform X1 [Lycorma delicatula]|uniref:ribonuclease P protein subunit p20-like isoform X1 n=1 Tax=Lycorma delicatula TaxID=130591 RepID=UPI003F51A6EF